MAKNKIGKKTKRARIIALVLMLIILAGASFVGYKLVRRHFRKPVVKQPVVEEEKKEEEEVQRLITVDGFDGDVEIYSPSANAAVTVAKGVSLNSTDEITVNKGKVNILIDSDKHIEADNNSKFSVSVKGNEEKGIATIEMEYGSILYTIDNPLNPGSAFDVKTPNAICSVRGTTFRVTYDKEKDITNVEVIKGKVEVTDKTDGKAYIVAEEKSLEIPYTDYGYFDDNVAPVFYVAYPQFAVYKKGNEDNSYPDRKFDPSYGITAVDAVDGDCTEAISYEITNLEDGRKQCQYSVVDKAGNVDTFNIYYSEESFLETEGDLYSANDVEVQYTMRESTD